MYHRASIGQGSDKDRQPHWNLNLMTSVMIKPHGTPHSLSPSDINKPHVIMPKTHATYWTLAVTAFQNSLYTSVAEQMVAFCYDNLMGK
jgi:hypothetical protein